MTDNTIVEDYTIEDMKDTMFIIDKARIRLLTEPRTAFFGYVLLQMNHVYDGHKRGIPTLAVDARNIYYNLGWIRDKIKSVDEMVFGFMHEISHVIGEHLDKGRIGDRNHMLWNCACDFVINNELVDNGFSMIEGGLHDRKYSGMMPEEVYDKLLEDKPDLTTAMIDIIAGEMDEESKAKLKDIIVSANAAATREHNDAFIPDSVKRVINELENPKIPWEQVLSQFVSEIAPIDYSWNRLNKTFFPDFYIPQLWGEDIGMIDFCIDVSGSISTEMFNTFVSELAYILQRFEIRKMGVYQFDTTTLDYSIVSTYDELCEIDFKGGGGTCFVDTINKAAKTESKAIIVITDGYMDLSFVKPNKPVIWCVYDNPNFVAPFGETILFDKYSL